MKKLIYSVSALFLLVSCIDAGLQPQQGGQILLETAVSTSTKDLSKDTKAYDEKSGIVNSSSDITLPMGLLRIDQNVSTFYPHFVNVPSVLSATMTAPDAGNAYKRSVNFAVPQFFRNSTDEVSFVGWSPWLTPDSSNGYAYSSDNTRTVVTIPVSGHTDILYANPVSVTQDSPVPVMDMQHALCQFKITAYAVQGSKMVVDASGNVTEEPYNTADLWGSINTMSIHNIFRQCMLTLDKSNYDFALSYGDKGIIDISASGTYTNANGNPDKFYFSQLDLSTAVGFDQRKLVGICLAPPPESGMLDLSFTASNTGAQVKDVSIARNFQPGYAYEVILRFSDHGVVNASVSVSDWQQGTEIVQNQSMNMYYDLSRYGTANSYVINSGNYNYSFDCTKKGNGVPLHGENVNINPHHVGIIWTDFDNTWQNYADEASHYVRVTEKPSLGRVLINVGDATKPGKVLQKEGNVLLGAYDESNNLLWTWHIWLTDRVEEQGYGNGYVVMDRNLGATESSGTNEQMKGLWYQWGRPTPFRASSLSSAAVTSTATAEDAVLNPDKLFGSGKDDWNSAPDNMLWGYKDERTELVKTMYDPCPHGYYVPGRNAWINPATAVAASFSATDGASFSIPNGSALFPTNGYYNESQTLVNDGKAYLWLAENDRSPWNWQYTASKTASASRNGIKNSSALQVRCVKGSRDTEYIRDLSEAQTANCYIVSKDGYYKFDATVRGNGVGSMKPVGSGAMIDISGGLDQIISPVKARLLWWQGDLADAGKSSWWGNMATPAITTTMQDNGLCINLLDGINDAEGGITDGYINFQVKNFKKGNAVIAAYDNFDNILWTWHIWFTDKPKDVAAGIFSMMDRNLGATSSAKPSDTSTKRTGEHWATLGFFYQGFRKDPFFGPEYAQNPGNNLNSSPWWEYDYDSQSWTKNTTIRVEETGESVTMAKVAKNPLVFYKNEQAEPAGAANNTNYTQIWVARDFHESNNYVGTSMWGYAAGTAAGNSFSKTMYDPCPPGYNVMQYNNTPANIVLGTDGTGYANVGWYTGQNVWFPYVGYRNRTGNLTNSGAAMYMYTSYPMNRYYSRFVDITYSNGGNHRDDMGPVNGRTVRCQKE